MTNGTTTAKTQVTSGSIKKLGGMYGLRSYQRRYAILNLDMKIAYLADRATIKYYAEKSPRFRGSIDLFEATAVKPDPDNNLRFCVETPKRTWKFEVYKPEDRTKWLDGLRMVMAAVEKQKKLDHFTPEEQKQMSEKEKADLRKKTIIAEDAKILQDKDFIKFATAVPENEKPKQPTAAELNSRQNQFFSFDDQVIDKNTMMPISQDEREARQLQKELEAQQAAAMQQSSGATTATPAAASTDSGGKSQTLKTVALYGVILVAIILYYALEL